MPEAQGGTPNPGTPDPAAAPTQQATPAGSPAPAAAAPAGAPAAPAPSAAPAGAPAGEPAPTAPPAAPDPAKPQGEDWAAIRTKIAGDDEKLAKRLARYSSVESVVDALVAAQNRIASGDLKSVLPENPTPEQLAAWRDENGIPEKPEGYEVKLPEGTVLGEEDKPFVDSFIKQAHAANMTPGQVNAAVAWHLAEQDRMVAERHADDARITAETTAVMKNEWGSEFELNRNLINGMLDTAPAGVKDQIWGARLPDGTPLSSHPDILRWLANTAREVNPVATVVAPNSNAMQAIETELAGIVKLMGDHNSAYWKGPEAEKMQARYRSLVATQQK